MLHIEGLSKSYGGRKILEPLSFYLPAGYCLGITGANGAGKSTLLRLVAQQEKPDQGTIRMGGVSVLGNRKFLREQVGYVPQHSDLMEDLTVQQQLKLWQSACGRSGPLPEDILAVLDIGPMLNKRIGTLSGGMQQRVSITMALLSRPKILILDEATAGLDRDFRETFLTYLEQYLQKGGRILFCSHDPRELKRLCGSCLHLQDGYATDDAPITVSE